MRKTGIYSENNANKANVADAKNRAADLRRAEPSINGLHTNRMGGVITMRDTCTCPHCNNKVAWNAQRCPSCGWRNPGASSAATGCFVIIMLPVAGIVWYLSSFEKALGVFAFGSAIIFILYYVAVFLMRR